MRRSLAARRSVIVDNTNVTPAERAAIIAIARELDARVVGYYIEATTARGGGAQRRAHRAGEGPEGGDLHLREAARAAGARTKDSTSCTRIRRWRSPDHLIAPIPITRSSTLDSGSPES